jgi:hypothetical protein
MTVLELSWVDDLFDDSDYWRQLVFDALLWLEEATPDFMLVTSECQTINWDDALTVLPEKLQALLYERLVLLHE